MNTTEFLNFRERLKTNLNAIDSVTGLAFLGSSADISRIDEWSDHDFFVFATDGQAEALRHDITWLPDYDDIALFVRETEHGVKVIYNSGHVLEFAVFEDDWELSGVNAFEVTLDKASILDRLSAAQVRSIPKPLDVDREFSLFLAHLLIGTGRFRRGEILSASQFINSFCMSSVVRLVTELCPTVPDSDELADNQNSFRRFEARYPKLAQELAALQRMDVESAACAMLEIVTATLADHLNQGHLEQVSVVKKRLNWQRAIRNPVV